MHAKNLTQVIVKIYIIKQYNRRLLLIPMWQIQNQRESKIDIQNINIVSSDKIERYYLLQSVRSFLVLVFRGVLLNPANLRHWLIAVLVGFIRLDRTYELILDTKCLLVKQHILYGSGSLTNKWEIAARTKF